MNRRKEPGTARDLDIRVQWLILLRWIAAGCLFLVITGLRFALHVDLPLVPLYAGNLALILLNGCYALAFSRIQSAKRPGRWIARVTALANAQISLDLVLLSWLIHFSGGIANPVVFFFIFHMVIASILLSNRNAYLQACFASAVLGAVTAGEQAGLLAHYTLSNLPPGAFPLLSWGEFFARYAALVATLFIVVYMCTTIVNKLRAREDELETTNIKLQDKDKIKSRYVMTVSHDIRGPLSVIQSCLRVVLDGYTPEVSGKSREMIERASLRTERLLAYVRDLLDLSRMRAAEDMDKTRLYLPDLLSRAIEQLRPLADGKQLEVTVANETAAAFIMASEEAMTEVIGNLLGNAIKYTPAGGRVALRIRDAADPDTLELAVADTGIGIPAGELPRIFEDFHRAPNAKEFEPDGTGLGLSIVKHIVEAYGGNIRAESEEGRGSTFTVDLPRG